MTDTDPILRNAVKQYLTELPAAERQALITELGDTSGGDGAGDSGKKPPAPKKLESVADGKALYGSAAGRNNISE